jgi:hypothetical protein
MNLTDAISICIEGAESRRMMWDETAKGLDPQIGEFYEVGVREAERIAEDYKEAIDKLIDFRNELREEE